MTTLAEAARLLAEAARQPRAAACAHCGAAFTARGRGLYCSRNCRQLAYAKRRRKAQDPGIRQRRGRPRKVTEEEMG